MYSGGPQTISQNCTGPVASAKAIFTPGNREIARPAPAAAAAFRKLRRESELVFRVIFTSSKYYVYETQVVLSQSIFKRDVFHEAQYQPANHRNFVLST